MCAGDKIPVTTSVPSDTFENGESYTIITSISSKKWSERQEAEMLNW